jgi:Tfp pilus assembly protein PilN
VRAVNLLPKDLRSAGAGGGSGSATGPTVLIAVLALAVVLVGAWAFTSRQVKDREAEVARLNTEAADAEQQAAGLAGYENTVKVADGRRTAVVDLVNSRFDWASAFEDVSRTVTDGYSMTAMKGTSAPSVTVDGGVSNPLRAAVSAPAIEVAGCAPSQGQVALLMSRLRSMKHVSKVSLSSTEKTDGGPSGTSDSANGAESSDCTGGSTERPRFNIVVFYEGAAAATTDPAAAGAASTTTSSTTTATGGAQ